MNNVKGKTVLITGGSSGYGKAMSKAYADAGAKVIIASRGEKDLKAAQAETNASAYFVMDVTKPSDWQKAYDFIIKNFGHLDILINNAGGGISIKHTADYDIETMDAIIRLNLNSVLYGCRQFAAHMRDRKNGQIINVASVCARQAWPGWGVYGAAKAGMLNFTKSLYLELQPHGVRATCLIPASANTKFAEEAGLGKLPPMRLQADDVAQTALFISQLPAAAVIEDVTVWGIDQVVNPL